MIVLWLPLRTDLSLRRWVFGVWSLHRVAALKQKIPSKVLCPPSCISGYQQTNLRMLGWRNDAIKSLSAVLSP